MDLRHHTARINGLQLHYVEAGQGPMVICLHGFPEYWYSWRYQLPALVEAGYRVVALDMRGYNQSEAPDRVSAYHVDELTRDVVALMDHLGEERAHLVSHDWGAVVAWLTAMWFPERVHRLAILNVPHPRRFLWGLWRPTQLIRSWYVFFFQLPVLPEFFFRAFNFAALRMALQREPVRSGAFTGEDIQAYITAFTDNKAVSAGINYYRAFLRYGAGVIRRLRPIETETLVIWGRRDHHLGIHLAEPYPEDVPRVRVEYLDASHWVQVDAYPDVNRLLIEFLG